MPSTAAGGWSSWQLEEDWMRYMLLIIILALAGCRGRAVHLYNPEPKESATCWADPWSTSTPNADNEACATVYESHGFKRVD
jgi:hypothetical protein